MADDDIDGRLVRQRQDMLHAEPRAGFAALSEKLLDGLLVACADILRIRDDPLAGLQIHERRRVAERKINFTPVQNLIDDHVMLLAAEMRQRRTDFFNVVEQIGKNHDQSAAAALLRKAVQRYGQIRLIRRLV